ncbi:MAG: aminotransferase class I/II-fold pyridoxal phosphate-dependent enzyme, partial [Bacteroidales bacterium]|nr:aminotransferase class I/II-fold pyridoxal phosphate-dependent enzyme [Bacteroidales bacterium]
ILTQQHAIKVLNDVDRKERNVAEILAQRDILRDLLLSVPCVKEVYPSYANFLLCRVSDADAIYAYLQHKGIIVRNRNRVTLCANCLRITVGTPTENAEIYETLKEI